jgi:hypothetical protein
MRLGECDVFNVSDALRVFASMCWKHLELNSLA